MHRTATYRPTPAALAAQFSYHYDPLVTFSHDLFRFISGRWQRLSSDALDAAVGCWLTEWSARTPATGGRHYSITDALVCNVTDTVRGLAPVAPAGAIERPIVIASGEPAGDLIAADEIITFDGRGSFTRRALTSTVFGRGPAVRFNADARCPLLDSFLENAIGDPRQIEALLRWLAGVLVPSRAAASARHVMLAGPSDAGGWSGHALADLLMALASPAAYATPRVPRRTALSLTLQRAIEASAGRRAYRFSLRGASDRLRAELNAATSAMSADAPSMIIESCWSVPAAALPHRYVPPSTLRIDLRDSPLEREVALHGRDELPGLMARALRAAGLLAGSERRSTMLPCQQPRQRLS